MTMARSKVYYRKVPSDEPRNVGQEIAAKEFLEVRP